MKKRFFAIVLTFAMLLCSGFSQVVLSDEAINEEVSVSPGKPLSFPQQERIANLAVKALKHIAKARGFIHTHNFADARGELAKSQKLTEIIRASLPTTRIKDHIWVAKKHLSYEDSEEVIPDLVPIYVSLDEIQSFVSVDKTREHLDEAKKALKADDKKKGAQALELAGESLVYVEIDLPLRYTERKVANAMLLMAEGKGKEADQVLKEAEDGVQVISISSYGPMVLAQESLWQATKDYAKGRYEAAKRSLADAKVFLKMAARQADDKTKKALAKLNRKIDELEKKMAESGSDFSKEIKGLWNKTKDVYHETVEKFKQQGHDASCSTGWGQAVRQEPLALFCFTIWSCMAGKDKSRHVCQNCGYETLKWLGRCPGCDQWGTLLEEYETPRGKNTGPSTMSRPECIDAISLSPELRWETGIAEFDRTLGGGLVPGSLVLIGGDPGIGKSTMILQVLGGFARRGLKSLYLSGEESAQQIKMRADRLNIRAENLFVMTGTCIEDFFTRVAQLKPDLLAVDSIQTFYTQDISSPPGSVSQVKETASRLMTFAKSSAIPVFLVGHVTKDGAIAGPKVLEHLVDTVLYFEGDRGHAFRILRAVKNRYGSTNEIGVFEMKGSGLAEVSNPSGIFLAERPEDVPGSAIISCMEGTRPLLVEIQALVNPSPLGMPRRTARGIDQNRISLLVAVLGKRLGMELGDQDIFVNVAGGLKIDEPAADLGIVSAMMSSFLEKHVNRNLVVFGEVGLAGEIRGVSQPDMRMKEIEKMGFSTCLLPKSNLEGSKSLPGLKPRGIGSIRDLPDYLFGDHSQ